VDMWMRVCATHDIAYVAEPLIILDNSDTPVRAFHWRKVHVTHAMHFANIRRMAGSSEQQAVWLSRQRRYSFRTYARHLAGRMARGDVLGFGSGCVAFPRFAVMAFQGAA